MVVTSLLIDPIEKYFTLAPTFCFVSAVEMKVLNYVVLANILKEHSLMFGVINPNSQVETICVQLNLTELDGGICFCFQLENKKQKPLNKLSSTEI